MPASGWRRVSRGIADADHDVPHLITEHLNVIAKYALLYGSDFLEITT